MSLREHARDIDKISRFGFKHPSLLHLLKDIKNNEFNACLVVEEGIGKRRFIGYVVYKWSDEWIYILDLAILPELDEYTVKKQIVQTLIARSRRGPRTCIIIDVRERNFVLQTVLRDCDFRAIRVLRDFFGDEDAYRMIYIIEGRDLPLEAFNRKIGLQLVS